jgi:hypothetical protein
VSRHVLVLVGIALACAGLAWGVSSLAGRARPSDALAAAPESSSLVAQVDVPALLASPLWAGLAGGDDGLERVRRDCGFDPLESLRTVAIFVIGTDETPFQRVGFVARGDLEHERLAACVQHVVEADGGAIERTEIEGVTAIASAHGPSRAAFLGRDAIVGGDEALVREAIRVDRGDARAADEDASLARMWRRVHGRREIVLAAHVPPNWREWLGRIGGGSELDAIEDVRTIGVGARVREGLGLTVAIEADDAARLVRQLEARIDGWLGDPLLRLSPAGGALRAIDLEVEGGDAIASLDLDAGQLAAIVDLARAILERRRAPRPRPAAARALAPDETIPATP